jgi:plastocyanin
LIVFYATLSVNIEGDERMTVRNTLLASILLLITAPLAWSKDHTVMVGQQNGQPANWFTPQSLPAAGDIVNPGDTITFVNAYATGLHNAHSTDVAFTFRCGSGGCVDSAPATGLWMATVTVPATAAGKTINYQCDQHGLAMVGSITVSVPTPVRLQEFDVD